MDLNFQNFKVGNSKSRSVAIAEDWNVLEIGGGANPCPRSNVITNYNHAKNQRDAPIKVVPGAKMLECDVQNMKKVFKDNEFDFCLCIQVLEHVECPEDACNEIMRVAKRGYIETPSEFTEICLGWDFHKWIVRTSGPNSNQLTFIKKQNNHYKILDSFFKDMFYKNNRNRDKFKEIFFKYPNIFLTSFYWDGAFTYEVFR